MDRREYQVDHSADEDDVADRADPRALAQRYPQQQDGEADDDRPRPDAETQPAREPLVEDVPRVEAQAGEQEQR
jgi:hypothetical protein